MKISLPTPLPYDVVDQMYDHITWDIHDNGHTVFIEGFPGRGDVGNWTREMFSVINDSHDEYEDEEGYGEWPGSGTAHVWTAREWTDEEIDSFLGLTA